MNIRIIYTRIGQEPISITRPVPGTSVRFVRGLLTIASHGLGTIDVQLAPDDLLFINYLGDAPADS